MRRVLTTCLIFAALLAGVAALVLLLSGDRLIRKPAPLTGMDTGVRAQVMMQWDLTLLEEWGRTGSWIRLRGHPIPADQPELIADEVFALHQLSALGFKPVILLRWGEKTWQNGIRPGGGQRLPHDLREAYQRAFAEGRVFGRTGAAFEFENEPDISFVQENPETYLAFLKACYLGVKAGGAMRDGGQRTVGSKTVGGGADRDGYRQTVQPSDRGGAAIPYRLPLSAERRSSPRVVMAPLALPPGPYFEQMVANGLFSYTDAFNYHYYGYAEDFAGVYRQFATAVNELGNVVGGGGGAPPPQGRGGGGGGPPPPPPTTGNRKAATRRWRWNEPRSGPTRDQPT